MKENRDFVTVLKALVNACPSNLMMHMKLTTLLHERVTTVPSEEPELNPKFEEKLDEIISEYMADLDSAIQSPWAVAFLAIYNDVNYIEYLTTLVSLSRARFVHDERREPFARLYGEGLGDGQSAPQPMAETMIRFRTKSGEMRTGWINDIRLRRAGNDLGCEALVITDDEFPRQIYSIRDIACYRYSRPVDARAAQFDRIPPEQLI